MRANRSWVKQFAELQVENQLLKQKLEKVHALVEKWRGTQVFYCIIPPQDYADELEGVLEC
jgi:hypothetical protein